LYCPRSISCAIVVLAEKCEEFIHANINYVENPEISRKNSYRHSFSYRKYTLA
jgi:hypothetical protein